MYENRKFIELGSVATVGYINSWMIRIMTVPMKLTVPH